ncbi:MAG: phosphoribosylglycinamide formyltransferase [Acidobacteriota bacterium]
MRRLGILLSGRGSNFEAIADHIDSGDLQAQISVVISNVATAPGLEKARQRGLEAVFVPSKGVGREEFESRLQEVLRQKQVDLICLAGFMRLLSRAFIQAFPLKILNIHPSLLPAFPGLDAQRQALHHGVKISGCTVHFVDEGLDSGPIVGQACVPVLDEDTEETLSARILKEEHHLYWKSIQRVLAGHFRVEGRRVIWTSENS